MVHPQTLALDTSVLSEFAKPIPDPACLSLLAVRPRLLFVLPFPVLVEINVGVHPKRLAGKKNWEDHRRWVDQVMSGGMKILMPTELTAAIYAEMITTPQLKNYWFMNGDTRKQQPDQDLLIAAIAISHNCPLATMNVRDFVLINQFFPLPGILHPAMGWIVPPNRESTASWDEPTIDSVMSSPSLG